jgi:hypothetical protein
VKNYDVRGIIRATKKALYQECYEIYRGAKKEMEEEPLAYEDWLILEKDAKKGGSNER